MGTKKATMNAFGECLEAGVGKCRIIENTLYANLQEEPISLDTNRCKEFQSYSMLFRDCNETGSYVLKIWVNEKSPEKLQKKKCLREFMLNKYDFCGVENGTYLMSSMTKSGRDVSREPRHYFAIILKSVTVLYSWNDANKGSSTFLNKLAQRLRENSAFVSCWTVSPIPSLPLNGKEVLLLTTHNLSLATQNGHMCLKMWPVKDCNPSSLHSILELNFKQGPKLNFSSNRAESICRALNQHKKRICPPAPDPERSRAPAGDPTSVIEEYYQYAKQQHLMSEEPVYNDVLDSCTQPASEDRNHEKYLTIDLNKLAKHSTVFIRKTVRSFYERQSATYSDSPPLPQLPLSRQCSTEESREDGVGQVTDLNIPCDLREAPDTPDDISRTLTMVLSKSPLLLPLDTIRLGPVKRRKLCLGLYNAYADSKPDWENLAGEIGLGYDAVILVKALMLNQLCSATAGEIVLLHWQQMYNKYYGTDLYTCEQPCTIVGLLCLLEKINRRDLVNEIVNG